MADLMRDQHLLPQAQLASELLIEKFPLQSEALIFRWLRHARQYEQV